MFLLFLFSSVGDSNQTCLIRSPLFNETVSSFESQAYVFRVRVRVMYVVCFLCTSLCQYGREIDLSVSELGFS